MAFEQAVSLAKEETGRSGSSQIEVHSSTQSFIRGIQCCLLDTYSTSLHPDNELSVGLHCNGCGCKAVVFKHRNRYHESILKYFGKVEFT